MIQVRFIILILFNAIMKTIYFGVVKDLSNNIVCNDGGNSDGIFLGLQNKQFLQLNTIGVYYIITSWKRGKKGP